MTTPAFHTKEMLSRLQQGEEKAFEAIYWKYSAWVYNFILSLLNDRSLAEDLTQTVFLKVWERHAAIRPDASFESYLFTIARNMVHKEIGSRLLAERLLAAMTPYAEADSHTEDLIETESLREYIDSLIEQLPPVRKKIYQLSRQQHLSHKEIAGQLSISEKTVETQLYRALQSLRRKLAEDNNLLLLFAFLFVK